MPIALEFVMEIYFLLFLKIVSLILMCAHLSVRVRVCMCVCVYNCLFHATRLVSH